jgi:hypothetical protein
MKENRSFLWGASGVALALGLVLALDRLTPSPTQLPLGRFMSAASTFVLAQQAAGLSVPDVVRLQDLMAGGYLDAADAGAFAGSEVSLSLAPDQSRPQAVRLLVKLPDGHKLALFDDGSVQTLLARN